MISIFPAVVIVHDAVPGRGEREVGSVGPALAALGYEVLVTTLVDGRPEPDPREAALVVVLGSEASASDDPGIDNRPAWLDAELDWLRRCVDAGTPVLGICFGAQALARVLGAHVGRAPRPERGFVRLGSADGDALPAGTWLEFHDDAFTLPPGATELARNDVGVQAFVHGPHLGVQFHPEITPDAFATWDEAWTEAGLDVAVGETVDLVGLRADVRERDGATRVACHDLVARFAARAARWRADPAGARGTMGSPPSTRIP
jgi:GMP synthase (glutamine-hydrolysing)